MTSPIPATYAPDSSYTPPESFAVSYQYDKPIKFKSVSSYSRHMHQHTKRQMDLATRRRSPADGSRSQSSDQHSIDSVDGLRQ